MQATIIPRYSNPPANRSGACWVCNSSPRRQGEIRPEYRALFRSLTGTDEEPLYDLHIHLDEVNPWTQAPDNIWRSPDTNVEACGTCLAAAAMVLGFVPPNLLDVPDAEKCSWCGSPPRAGGRRAGRTEGRASCERP
jgi:hypothetical protein